MPVNKHNNMLAKQFLLSTMRPNHPNHSDINHIPPQLMKDNLVSRYSTAVKPLVPDGTIDENLYKKGLKKIHTDLVMFTIMEQKANKVPGRMGTD